MADLFHRLVTPTYNTGGGTFPSEGGTTYDYINNAGAGTPAFADTAKVGGANAGTYFSAFAEDATSNNVNRANFALAQNCDHLDNLLHRSLAAMVRTADTTAVGAVATLVIPIGTFLGIAGYTTSTADLQRLFHVTDTSDNDIIIPGTGNIVQITSVTLGGGDQINGGGASGNFSANTVTLNFTPSIPNGQAYRLYYGSRANLATLPLDAFTNIKIRTAEEVDGTVEQLFRLLHGNNESWNGSWDSTVFDMAFSGLQERYDRATVANSVAPPESGYFPAATFDTPGSGAFILRRGSAVTVYANDTGAYLDPLNALVAGKFFDKTPATSGGAVGFAVFGSRQTATALTGETLDHTPGAYAFTQLWPHYFQSNIHATRPFTRIVDFATATLANHGAYNVNTGELIVTVTQAGNYFRDGSGNSAISLGHDLLELTYTLGGNTKKRYVVVVAHGETGDTANVAKVRIRNLDGTVWDITGASAFHLRWVSVTSSFGDGAGAFHAQANTDVGPVLGSTFLYQVPQNLSSNAGDDNIPWNAPGFSAAKTTAASNALRWGGFQYSNPSGPLYAGFLNGDGGATFGGQTTVGGGLWPKTTGFSAVVRHIQMRIAGVGSAGDAGTTHSDTSRGPNVFTKAGATTADYFDIDLSDIPDDADLASVVISTATTNASTNNPTTKAQYQLIRCDGVNNFDTMSTLTNDSHTYGGGGTWITGTQISTTVTVNAGGRIVKNVYTYSLRVHIPADAAGTDMIIWWVSINYTPNTIRV